MSYYIKDSFDMPHNVGVTANVTRLDDVIMLPNLFGGMDARIFSDSSDIPTKEFPNVRVAIEDPEIRAMLGVVKTGSCYPDIDDIVLVCEKIGKFLCWYEVTYAYYCKTDE